MKTIVLILTFLFPFNLAFSKTVDISTFFQLASKDNGVVDKTLAEIDNNWELGYAVILIETVTLISTRETAFKVFALLNKKTNQDFGLVGTRPFLIRF